MIEEALRQLCSTNRTFLGAFIMMCIILGVLLHAVNYFINSNKPKTSKKPLLWVAETVILVIAFVSMFVYLATPVIIKSFGIDVQNPDCPPGNQDNLPPYCGEYCHNQSVAPAYENCTCIQY